MFTRFVEEHQIGKAPASWFPVQRDRDLSKKDRRDVRAS
jgi:hypothetical protein